MTSHNPYSLLSLSFFLQNLLHHLFQGYDVILDDPLILVVKKIIIYKHD